MSDEIQVCDCNGVCKGDIVMAISQKGLFTLDDVKLHTKAAASCGSCTGLVEQILASTLGSDYSAPEAKPLCKCTDYTHDQVRAEIKDRRLTDAGFVSGHACGKAMRTVKTCVGSEWCRFGVQNSTKMGVELATGQAKAPDEGYAETFAALRENAPSIPVVVSGCGSAEQDVADFYRRFAVTERTVTLSWSRTRPPTPDSADVRAPALGPSPASA
jgi:bacterioferritin-associated ferredoxin